MSTVTAQKLTSLCRGLCAALNCRRFRGALAEKSLSLEMSSEDLEQFAKYPERIYFRGLRSFDCLIGFDESLLDDLELLGVFTVYGLFHRFPKASDFTDYLRQMKPSVILPFASLRASYDVLQVHDQFEKRALEKLADRFELLTSSMLQAALSKAGIEREDQLLNYSRSELIEMVSQSGAEVMSELHLLLGRLGMGHSERLCLELFTEQR